MSCKTVRDLIFVDKVTRFSKVSVDALFQLLLCVTNVKFTRCFAYYFIHCNDCLNFPPYTHSLLIVVRFEKLHGRSMKSMGPRSLVSFVVKSL